MTSLALSSAVARYQWEDGNVLNQVEAHYLEIIVDGQPLSELVSGLGYRDLVTSLCRLWLEDVPDAVEHLLGNDAAPNLAPDRVALMVCKIDGDILCGAITARLTLTDDEAVWSDWLW